MLRYNAKRIYSFDADVSTGFGDLRKVLRKHASKRFAYSVICEGLVTLRDQRSLSVALGEFANLHSQNKTPILVAFSQVDEVTVFYGRIDPANMCAPSTLNQLFFCSKDRGEAIRQGRVVMQQMRSAEALFRGGDDNSV